MIYIRLLLKGAYLCANDCLYFLQRYSQKIIFVRYDSRDTGHKRMTQNQHSSMKRGLGARIWDNVLKKLNYQATAIKFQGRRTLKSIQRRNLTITQYVKEAILSLEKRRIIVLIHSIRSLLSIELAHLLLDKLVRFITIGVPSSTGSFIPSLPRTNRIILQVILHFLVLSPQYLSYETDDATFSTKRIYYVFS